jgi:predicted RNA-binding protein associated with RNAse of E/G family
VTISESSRSSYDADILAGLIKPGLFKKVTKVAVDADKLKAAVKTELIAQDVADAATKTTTFTRILVAPVSAESKSTARATSAA